MYTNQYNDGTNRRSIYSFNGLNRTRKGSVSEFEDMTNMSSKEYPCTSPRGRRKEIAKVEGNIQAVAPPDGTISDTVTGFTGIKDNAFYYNGERKTSVTLPIYKIKVGGYEITFPEDCQWEIKRLGRLYIINGFNAKINRSYLYCYNPVTDEFNYGNDIMPHLCVGFDYETGDQPCFKLAPRSYTLSGDFPEAVKKEYAAYKALYNRNSQLVNSGNIFKSFFKVGDEIRVEGFNLVPGVLEKDVKTYSQFIYSDYHNTEDNLPNTPDYSDSEDLKYLSEEAVFSCYVVELLENEHRMNVKFVNKNNSKIDTNYDTTYSGGWTHYATGITISKKQPNLSTIGTHHNRIWGTTPSGRQVFASAADDIFSFSGEDLVNMYAAYITSNTSSRFTGMCSYGGDMLAFKEDSITVISGTNATNYYADTLEGIGCIDGKSIAQTPEGVIFLSRRGFYIYNGSYPQRLNTKLNTVYTSATAGYNGREYIACAVRSDNGERELVKYDMERGLWHKEDNINAKGIFPFKDKTYICDTTTLYECDNPEGLSFEWDITSVLMRDNTLDNKAISEIWVLAEVSPNSCFKVWTQTDNGEWRMHSAFTEAGLNLYRCPVRGELGINYRYKISGTGEVVIYEIELVNADTDGRRHKEREGTITPVNSPAIRPDELLIYD